MGVNSLFHYFSQLNGSVHYVVLPGPLPSLFNFWKGHWKGSSFCCFLSLILAHTRVDVLTPFERLWNTFWNTQILLNSRPMVLSPVLKKCCGLSKKYRYILWPSETFFDSILCFKNFLLKHVCLSRLIQLYFVCHCLQWDSAFMTLRNPFTC